MNVLQPTDYASLNYRVTKLLSRDLGDFTECAAELVDVMREEFPALTLAHNPVIAQLEALSPKSLGFIIGEYSGFSNAAIHMFVESRIRNRWPNLTMEIIRNMDEEYGAETHGVPHLELMRHGYRVELGIDTDQVQHTPMTRAFIDRMTTLFLDRDNVFLAGVLLAFETTAVDEFQAVARILHRYADLIGVEITEDSLTGRYIAGHVVYGGATETAPDPEMEHFLGMVNAIGASIGDGNLTSLVRGFLSICLELNRWWELIAVEAWQHDIRAQLAERGEWIDPYLSLRETEQPALVDA